MLEMVELFAGIGGFRVGFEKADPEFFKTVLANQWEPGKKNQHAFNCYNANFRESYNVNEDIHKIPDELLQNLEIDVVVGGFPCQDYSCARSLSNEQGITGKKGVLFWQIKRVVEHTQPTYILLENVDRLLKSPSKQRGRDFAIMLATFRDLGYTVEWRVINAAEYGASQRRRRVFIFAYKDTSAYAQAEQGLLEQPLPFLLQNSYFARTFPVETLELYKDRYGEFTLPADVVEISDTFAETFHMAGVMKDGKVHTLQPIPKTEPFIPIGDILQPPEEIDEKYYLNDKQVDQFAYLRGPKKKARVSADGHAYTYSEGGMSPTDLLQLPGRTMLTSEGTVNRSTHIVDTGRIRYLTPIECERLNGLPDNWTADLPDRARYFCMGNALVVDMVERMAKELKRSHLHYTRADTSNIPLR